MSRHHFHLSVRALSRVALLAPGVWWADVWLRGGREPSATGDSNGGRSVRLLQWRPQGCGDAEEKGVTRWVLPSAARLLHRVPAAAGVRADLRQLGREGAGVTERPPALPPTRSALALAHSGARPEAARGDHGTSAGGLLERGCERGTGGGRGRGRRSRSCSEV
uniref:Uncharacterized protein n=1 Tax=Rangifer tarandus platyrhynchus TaxID=3082113 RepID=A0ACB0DWD2_RANTA|nr:unnamed protein product [Rangifer tarandus platyrhynchus]